MVNDKKTKYRIMKKGFIVLVVILLTVFSGWSQTRSIQKSAPLSESKPELVGMSAERLNRIDAMCKEAISKGDVPGIVALVARNGEIVFNEAYGLADNESGRELKKDDIFRIASQSKAITSTAVMMLWEEGLFRLDDPISKYIPEFKQPRVLSGFHFSDTTYNSIPAKREITIRDLLSHQSGLGYGVIDGDERMRLIYEKAGITDLFTTKDISIKESVLKLAKLPLHHNPGEKFTYSEGLDVLGYFIEVISGIPFDQYLRVHLLDPLGMNDTWFYLPDDKSDRLVTVQHPVNGEWERLPVTFYDPDYPKKGARKFFSGGAGLSSTAKDYATFLQMYLNGGELNGVRILSRTTVNTIMADQIHGLWEGREMHFGLAFSVQNDLAVGKGGIGSSGTFDWSGYFNTQYFADPKEKIVGILMKQTIDHQGDNTAWQFRQLVFQAIDD
jgi:CubicO group peptidase (beta-lactamase class C family)